MLEANRLAPTASQPTSRVAGTTAGVAGLIGARAPRGVPGDPTNSRGSDRASERLTSSFKLSVTRWPFGKFTLDELSIMARELGIDSVELLEPNEWAVPRK